MNKLSFIFFCTLYISVSIFSFAQQINIETQILICGIIIGLVGIPHGAIDHLLYVGENKKSTTKFYIIYLTLMLIYTAFWFLAPPLAFGLFLLVSAYHFGESQLTQLNAVVLKLKRYLFTAWGINIISALILYNQSEITGLVNNFQDINLLAAVFDFRLHQFLLVTSTIILIVAAGWTIFQENVEKEIIFKEVYTLAMIHLAFYLLPLFAGFTLYFVVLHSFKVLIDEYQYLKMRIKNLDLISFILKLLPFTFLSLFGFALIMSLAYFEIIYSSYVYLSLFLISVITLPHSFVMQKFYNNGQTGQTV